MVLAVAPNGPRTWSQVGNSAASSAALTIPFYPSTITVENADTTNAFNINWMDTVATVTNDGTTHNFRVNAGKGYALNFDNPNVQGPFIISIIAVAGTPAFTINALGAR